MKTFKCEICGKTWSGGVISMLRHILSACAFTPDDRDSGRNIANGSSAGGGEVTGGLQDGDGLKYGYFRQDWSGHYYVIPEDVIEAHDKLVIEINTSNEYSHEWRDLNDVYNTRFSQYRVDGKLWGMKIVMGGES